MAALDKVIDLAAAVAEHVCDGMVAALEDFGHLIPFAAAHQIIRQGRRDLTLCRLTPDLVITPLAVLSRPDKFSELMISEVHPGLTVDDVQDATGWDIPVADDVRVTARPTEDVRLLDDTAGAPRPVAYLALLACSAFRHPGQHADQRPDQCHRARARRDPARHRPRGQHLHLGHDVVRATGRLRCPQLGPGRPSR